MADPLVVTLTLDPDAQARLDELRTRWFPPSRNHLGAHVTLFHALPGEQVDAVRTELAATCGATEPFEVTVSRVRSLGRGVALDVRAAELDAVHARLAAAFRPWLTRQDAQRFSPHVTVQNKVEPEQARALAAELTAGFTPWAARALGLDLWEYRGGPWSHVAAEPFPGRAR